MIYIGPMHALRILFFLLSLLTSSFLFAGENAHAWSYLTDAPPHYSLEEIRAIDEKSWRHADSDLIGAGFMRHSLWLKRTVHAEQDHALLLELANPPLDRITLYLLRNDGHLEIFHSGSAVPRPSWQPAYQHELFPFRLQGGEQLELYLQIQGNESLMVRPRLFTTEQFAEQSRHDRLWTGAFTGIFLAISLHCLMVWLGTRDRDFLNSCLFIFGLGLLQSNLAGVLHEYLLYDSPRMMAFSRSLLPALAFLAYIRFSIHFLNLPHFCPRAHQVLRMTNWLIYLQFPIFLLWGNAVSMPLIMILGASLILTGLLGGFVAWSRGFRPARFYLFANTLLFGGGMIYILTAFNILPNSSETLHAFHAGTIGEALLIAFSLSDKINTLQKERARAQSDRLAAEKKVIETLRESEALLEERVRERTEQLEASLHLQHEQATALQTSNHKLQSLNEDMNAYMSVAAHDLKNPTSAIIGFIDLLTERWESWDTGKKLDKLGKIREMATHIHAIISKLLDINAIESGHTMQGKEIIDLSAYGERVANEYAEALCRKNLHLALHHPGPIPVIMDRDALLQILDNLVSNAIKYSPPGKQIDLALAIQGNYALIQVRDEGPGISPDEQEKLFRKFAKLSARPTAGEHSTGLGLYIVKKLVESCAGQIRCESRLGEGTCFMVSLPLAGDQTE